MKTERRYRDLVGETDERCLNNVQNKTRNEESSVTSDSRVIQLFPPLRSFHSLQRRSSYLVKSRDTKSLYYEIGCRSPCLCRNSRERKKQERKKKKKKGQKKKKEKGKTVRIPIGGETESDPRGYIYLVSSYRSSRTVASQKHAAIFSREHLLGVPYDVCV